MNDSKKSTLKISAAKETWSVVVLYEDKATRDRALAVCDHLVKHFWAEVEFDFHWWRTGFLTDPPLAQTAAQDARGADVIIFSSAPEGEFSLELLQWFEEWVDQRGDREGMLLGLTQTSTAAPSAGTKKQLRLREIANRARLDYLTQAPPQSGGVLPNSWQNAEARAGQVTSVLDEILNKLPPPQHFGIND